jgi:hypothetical protein
VQGNGGQFWLFAEMLYESAVNLTPDESTVRNFVDVAAISGFLVCTRSYLV